jgi:hypothetical protein
MGEIGPLLELWKQAVPEGLEDRRIILNVDAVAFRPLVTLSEDGTIDGLMPLTAQKILIYSLNLLLVWKLSFNF